MAALAPVAERLARRPRTPTDAAPACAVAIERALADEAVVAVVARTPDAEAHNALVAFAEAHVVVATAALAPVAELSCAPSANAPGRCAPSANAPGRCGGVLLPFRRRTCARTLHRRGRAARSGQSGRRLGAGAKAHKVMVVAAVQYSLVPHPGIFALESV